MSCLLSNDDCFKYNCGQIKYIHQIKLIKILEFKVKLLWKCVVFVHRHINRYIKAKYTWQSLVKYMTYGSRYFKCCMEASNE